MKSHSTIFRLLIFCLFIIPILDSIQATDCEIISYECHNTIIKNKLIQKNSYCIQINNRNGERLTNISIPYSASNKITNLSAHLEDIFGNQIRKIKKSEISTRSAISDFSLYEDDFVKYFTLKHNSYPYKVIYSYEIEYSEFLVIERWSPVVLSEYSTKYAKLTVERPEDYKILIYERGNFKKTEKSSNEVNIQTWEGEYLDLIKPESYSPPLEELIPIVTIQPIKFQYGLGGSLESWDSYGNWQYRLKDGTDNLSFRDQAMVNRMKNETDDKRDLTKALYHYVQDNTRYINVTIDIGGLKPYPASYVSENKYGDCKALTNYMQSLLNNAGIESFYSKIYGNEMPINLIEQMPGQQFNHIILNIPFDGDTVWLDCTNQTLPFGYAGIFNQNRKALLVKESGSHLQFVPPLSLNQTTTKRDIQVMIHTGIPSKAKINLQLRGELFEEFDYYLNNLSENDRRKAIDRHLPLYNYEILDYKLIRPDRDSAYISCTGEIKLINMVEEYGNNIVVTSLAMDLPNLEEVKERKNILRIPYHIAFDDSIVYQLPNNYRVKSLPNDCVINNSFGYYHYTIKVKQNQIIQEKSFVLYSGDYSLDNYPEIFEFVESSEQKESESIIIEKIQL